MPSELEILLETFDPELHSQRLREWLLRPHVAPWWGDPERALRDVLRWSPDCRAVIVADGAPVGFACWERPGEERIEAAGLADLPEDLIDIDVLIGEPEFMGRGVGPLALGLLLDRLRADPAVAVAGLGTSTSNVRAIRAFEKAGFRRVQEFQDPTIGLCTYMVVDVREAC